MGLVINEDKAKYMLSTNGVVPRMGSQITANSYNFDVVKEFIYCTLAPPLTQTSTSDWKSSEE